MKLWSMTNFIKGYALKIINMNIWNLVLCSIESRAQIFIRCMIPDFLDPQTLAVPPLLQPNIAHRQETCSQMVPKV